jgi:diguanylate cyclase (GGDEF)-like protein/PAS domain S-box-containing protein
MSVRAPSPSASTLTAPLRVAFRRLALLVVVVWAVFGIYMWYQEKNEELARLTQLSDLAARGADQFFDRFEHSELVLGQELLALGVEKDPERARAPLLRLLRANPELSGAHVVRPDGQILFSTRIPAGAPSPSAAALPGWREMHSNLPPADLNILRPHRSSLTDEWVIGLHHPVKDDRGNVAFVLVATLPLENQQAIWRALSFPPGTTIGLIREDGYFQSLWPVRASPSDIYSRPAKCAALDLMRARRSQSHGTFGGTSDICGPGVRIGSYHRLSRFPMAAIVSIPRSDIWAHWFADTKMPVALFFILGVGMVGIYRLASRLAVASDHERGAAEKALMEASRRNELILTAAGEGIYGLDLQGRTVFANPAAATMLGYEVHELIGQKMHDLVHYAHADGTPYPESECPHYAALRRGIAHHDVDEVFWTKDGEPLPIEYVSTPMREDGHAVTGAVVVVRDIRARKRQEAWTTGEKRVLEMIAKSEALSSILAALARLVDEESDDQFRCSILLLASDEAHLKVGAAPNLPLSLSERLDGLALSSNTTCTAAAHRRQPVMVTDLGREPPDTVGLRDAALESGLHGCWASPILSSEQQLLGVCNVYYREARALTPAELGVVDRATRLAEIAIKKIRMEERLGFLAHRDPLTSLPNRALLHDRLQHALVLARRHRRVVGLLYVDLDRFKHVNDTLGHEAGDQLLMAVARRFRGCVRNIDTVARQGGDEFLVVLEEVAKEQDVSEVAQKMLQSLSEPLMIAGHELFITCSIGVSLFPRDGEDPSMLVKNADTAMYRAKERGRNQIQFFTEEMNFSSSERFELTNQLRRAVRRDEFKVYYQPKVALNDGHIAGVEALLRWRHPEQGVMLPSRFVPLLEDSGLIIPVGEWVLRTACAQNRAWQMAGFPVSPVAVNISGLQFRQGHLLKTISDILADTGLDPRYLELELTESLIMQESQVTVETLRSVKEMGIRVSIDDFGTGYSSLSYLKHFPVDAIKIDQSFIHDIARSAEDAAIADALITMAHGLRLKVIAEGVETADQLRCLRQRDCDEVQGNLFSVPVPAELFTRVLSHTVSLPNIAR